MLYNIGVVHIGGELFESVGVEAPILLSYTHKNEWNTHGGPPTRCQRSAMGVSLIFVGVRQQNGCFDTHTFIQFSTYGCACRLNTLQLYSDKAQNLLSKLHEHCLIRFALCRIWSVCRNAALRRNSTFLRRIRCALSPKLIALFSNTSSLILINCDALEYG